MKPICQEAFREVLFFYFITQSSTFPEISRSRCISDASISFEFIHVLRRTRDGSFYYQHSQGQHCVYVLKRLGFNLNDNAISIQLIAHVRETTDEMEAEK